MMLRQDLYARSECAECHSPVGGRIGTIEMEVGVERFRGVAAAAATRLALFKAVLLLVLLVLGVLAVRSLATRLRGLSGTMSRITAGELSLRLPTEPKDEVAELAGSFNRLLAEL